MNYTLLNCWLQGSSTTGFESQPIADRRNYIVEHILRGYHLSVPSLPIFDTLEMQFEHLDIWLDSRSVEVTHLEREGDLDIRYRRPATIRIPLEAGKVLSIHQGRRLNYGTTAISIKDSPVVSLFVPEPQPLEFFQEAVRTMQDFFSVACLRFAKPLEIRVGATADTDGESNAPNRYIRAQLLSRIGYTDPYSERTIKPDLLFTQSDLADRVIPIISAWFSKSKDLRMSRILYIAAIYGNGFLELCYLNLCQAIETYHRSFKNGYYMDSDEFNNEVLPRLRSCIPNSLEKSHKHAINARLKYSNEYSLRKRLKLLIDEHAEALLPHVRELKNLADEIVDYRNELTHYSSSMTVNYDRLMYLRKVVRLLIELCFLEEMGFSAEERSVYSEKNRTYRILFPLS